MPDPFSLGAAGIGAIGGVVSNLIGSNSQKSANATQLHAQDVDLKWREGMYYQQLSDALKQWNRQNEWNLEQWNRENEYNSAAAQVQRLREAGLNPALAFGAGNAGTASNVQSADGQQASAPGTSGIPNIGAYKPDMSGILSAVDVLSNMQLKQAQSTNQFTGAGLNVANTNNANAATPGVKAQSRIHESNARVAEQTEEARIQSETLKNNLTSAQVILTNLNAAYQQKLNDTFDQKFQAEMALSAASTLEKNMTAWRIGMITPTEVKLNLAKARREISEAMLADSRKRGQDISNDVADAISGDLIEQAGYESMKAYYESRIAMFNSSQAQFKAEDMKFDLDYKNQRYNQKYGGTALNGAIGRFYDAGEDFFNMFKGVISGGFLVK